ncbi:MAG: hypothetical protein KAT71_07000, partial [Gammaproteobacteria bacterium]|nr:hypothetical protein [Gammaproteobacteria bacterium]
KEFSVRHYLLGVLPQKPYKAAQTMNNPADIINATAESLGMCVTKLILIFLGIFLSNLKNNCDNFKL